MTDTEILGWILKNVNYLEHHASKENPYNFWPHDNSDPTYTFQEDKLGLTLKEYIIARIEEENARCSYCKFGFEPKRYKHIGWAHTSKTHTTDQRAIKDGLNRLIVCIDKHPDLYEYWKDLQITEKDVNCEQNG